MSGPGLPEWREAFAGPRAVVLLHGIGGQAESWAPTLAALREWRVLAWNMPGYGASPPLDPVDFPGLADALRRMLDAAGVAKADLVGHSIGGMVAQEFAATWPERVRSLVLYASPPAFGGRTPEFRDRFLTARLAPLDAGRSLAELAPGLVAELMGPAPDPRAAALAIASMAAVPEASYRATLAALVTFDRRADLPRIACPTYVVAGQVDPMAPIPMLLSMVGQISGAEIGIIPGAGHLAHLEKPGEFNTLVRDFLRRVPE